MVGRVVHLGMNECYLCHDAGGGPRDGGDAGLQDRDVGHEVQRGGGEGG